MDWQWEHVIEVLWKTWGDWRVNPFNWFSKTVNVDSIWLKSDTVCIPPLALAILELKLSSLVVSHCIVFSARSSKNSQAAVRLLDKNPPWHMDSTIVLDCWSKPSYIIWHKRHYSRPWWRHWANRFLNLSTYLQKGSLFLNELIDLIPWFYSFFH